MKAPSASVGRNDRSPIILSLRTCLVAVILLATLPIVGLTGYWISADIQQQRQLLRRELQQSADALASAADRELAATIDLLSVLISMESLRRGHLADFEHTLASVGQQHADWTAVYLARSDGAVLFESPPANAAEGRRTVASPKPHPAAVGPYEPVVKVSEPQGEGPSVPAAIAVELPVLLPQRERYRLGVRIGASFWQTVLRRTALPSGAVARLYDGQRRLLAWSGPDLLAAGGAMPVAEAGTQASGPPAVLRAGGSTPPARYEAGQAVALAGWQVAIGMPDGLVEARERRTVVAALLTGFACLALGISLALVIARRLTQPLRQLANNPQADMPARIVVREVARLRDALFAAKALEKFTHARLKAHRDLLQTKADEFETLFESCPIGLAFAQDTSCQLVLHNAAMTALFGPPVATAAHPVEVLHLGRPLSHDDQPLQRAAAHGEPVRGLELELRADGMPAKFVLVNAEPLSDSDGRPRGAISAVIDITRRKRAESRLASAEKDLRESQRLIGLAQEAGHVGFFSYLFEADVLMWTPGLSRLFGMAAVPRQSTWEFFVDCIAGEDRQRIRDELRTNCAGRQEKSVLEFRTCLPDGTRRWLVSSVAVSYGDDGGPQQLIGVTLDVTDQKAAERDRVALMRREHEARIEAEAANRAKDEFLAMLGHELRNPLSAISAAIEVLNHADASEATAASARGVIARQTRHLALLVDDLLDVARAIAGKILLTRRPINLAALVEQALATLRLTGGANRRLLSVDLKEVWIDADATRIEQVLNNLMNNALKFTPAGGSINVRVGTAGEQAVLEVRDSGVGIPPAMLPHIFDLFVQAEPAPDQRGGGLGIGLSLVRRLVELHGGTISVTSSAAGSVFTVHLPAVEAAGIDCGRSVVPSRRRDVGVVDDNEDALNALHELLELAGHTVCCASDGVAGLDMLLERRPDVALVDIGLPGLSGLELAKRSRAAGYGGHMIALSGYGEDGDQQRALAAGFDAYLVKPVDAQRLYGLLAER